MSTPNDENLMKYTQGHRHELAELVSTLARDTPRDRRRQPALVIAGSEADFRKQEVRHKNRNHGELVPTIRTK